MPPNTGNKEEWTDWDRFEQFLTLNKGMAPATIVVKRRRLAFAMRTFGLQPNLFRTRKQGKPEAERYLTARRKTGVRREAYNQCLFLLKNLAEFNRWKLDLKHQDQAREPNPNPMTEAEV